jgi:hypothetical protein
LAYSCSHFKTHRAFNVFYQFKCLSKFHIAPNTKLFGSRTSSTWVVIVFTFTPYIEIFTLCSKMGIIVIIFPN